MPNLGEIATILGHGFLGAAGPSGRAASASILNKRFSLLDAERQRAAEEQAKQEELVLEKTKYIYGKTQEFRNSDGYDAAPEAQRKAADDVVVELGTKLGIDPNVSIGRILDDAEGTLSQFGTVTVDGQDLAVAASNKGGVIFQEGPNKGKLVPGSVRSTFKPLKASEKLVGDITVAPVIDMTTATKSKLEGRIIDTSNALQRLSGIRSKFKADFLTVAGKTKAAGLDLAEKFSIPVTKANKEFLTDFNDFTVKSIRNINDYIKEVTGAQMSEFEAKRLRRGMPDPGDGIFGGMGPTKFQSALNSTYQDLALSNARAIIMRQRGIDYDFAAEENKDKEGPISFEETKSIINQRGEEVMAGLIAQGKSAKDAEAEAKRLVRQEFGMQ